MNEKEEQSVSESVCVKNDHWTCTTTNNILINSTRSKNSLYL